MLNRKSLAAVKKQWRPNGWVAPAYENYCFSRIPAAIWHSLGYHNNEALPLDVFPRATAKYDQVILILVDGFGWSALQHFTSNKVIVPLLELVKDATLSQLTAQFPSTTCAQITTINSGLPLMQHGAYEWSFYLPEAGRVISPIPYSIAGEPAGTLLTQLGIQPESFLPRPTFGEKLAAKGITSYVFQPREYENSPYDQFFKKGFTVCGYQNYEEGLRELAQKVQDKNGSQYLYFYLPDFDEASHREGPEADGPFQVARNFFSKLEQHLLQELKGKGSNTLLLLTSDHGQTTVDPTTTLNLDIICPELMPLLKTGRDGQPLIGAGSGRDCFLYVQETALEEARELLQKKLLGCAECLLYSELVAEGYFGSVSPSSQFLERVGNLVVLPRAPQLVFWLGKDRRFEKKFQGHHGGLSPEEMEIPFLACEL